jgi:hypothetical protein
VSHHPVVIISSAVFLKSTSAISADTFNRFADNAHSEIGCLDFEDKSLSSIVSDLTTSARDVDDGMKKIAWISGKVHNDTTAFSFRA